MQNLTLHSLTLIDKKKEYYDRLNLDISLALTEFDSLLVSADNFYECICLDENLNQTTKIVYVKSILGFIIAKLRII